MQTLLYPVGLGDFSEVIKGGYIYVDKTEYIHRLFGMGKYFFLSRPRRFGKSLLLSTIEAFFEGKKELFEGLAISNYDYSWEKHPVLHFNFVNADLESLESFKGIIESHLSNWEKIYGAETKNAPFAQRFYNVILRAYEKTHQQVAILIDEYDKPLFSTIKDEVLNDKIRSVLKPIFATLKAAEKQICFALFTGVTRFSRLSIFSDINNLNDISFDQDFDAICGITEEELQGVLKSGVEDFAKHLQLTPSKALAMLKDNYDGYHFSFPSPDIYNPFSLMSALQKRRIASFWYATGTPSFLLDKISEERGRIQEILSPGASESSLSEVESYADDIDALLFQTGYLTIKGGESVSGYFKLGIPNKEVEHSLLKGLLPRLSGNKSKDVTNLVTTLPHLLDAGDAEGVMLRLKSFLSDIPYHLSKNKPEIYFENNLYLIFRLLGYVISTEYATSYGRVDVVIKTSEYIYIIELKLDGSAEQALNQINTHDYALPFISDGRQIIKIGANFSKRKRNIDQWVIAIDS